jgi:ATP-dependent Clp protease ATP-binding subunit ClpA
MKMIVDKFIDELNGQLAGRKVSLTLSEDAREWLARNGHDPVYGARPLSRLIQTDIKDHISDQILFGRLEKGGIIMVNLEKDKLTFSYDVEPVEPYAGIPETPTVA